jgi:thiamine-monophosphate kinase
MLSLRSGPTIADIGEWGFLRALLPGLRSDRGVHVGVGDDCAVVAASRSRILLTTDALVEHVHFERAWMSARQIGRKAYLVNASDVAAMGGRPRFCLLSVGVPADFPAADLVAIERGVVAAASATGASLVGGNLSRADQLFLSLTLIGDAPRRPVTRGGARSGDLVFVTGMLGQAALGLKHLRRAPSAGGAAVRRFREPPCRVDVGAALAARAIASAMIDVSDGLLRDLSHVCAASRVGAEIRSTDVPCSDELRGVDPSLAMHGGEDYELLFTVPPRRLPALRRLRASLSCRVTEIGRILPRRDGLRVLDEHGRPMSVGTLGHDHFASASRSSRRSRPSMSGWRQ